MTDTHTADEPVRLQKVIAAAGLASRRGAEEMIVDGRVEVNGRLVTELGTRVDPINDVVRVDGSRIPPARHHIYLALNKPRGVVSTMDDPQSRPTVEEYIPRKAGRLFHVGRLDADTEGLLILTNDGDFAQRLSHPSFEIDKLYLVEVDQPMEPAAVKRLAKGVMLEDGLVKPDKVKVVSRGASKTLVELTLHSGRNRVVRRMMESLGYSVRRLARLRVGPIRLGNLPSGQTRELTVKEIGALYDSAGL
ncbi:MAG: rRNA pseudouridine synthase [Propionibacteriaceae bacterium]|jgi:23S rRNA pseudouridine2605 synthase|nr:rRNA pseudouridine synthase [Propionibacteriaceae bacterium]